MHGRHNFSQQRQVAVEDVVKRCVVYNRGVEQCVTGIATEIDQACSVHSLHSLTHAESHLKDDGRVGVHMLFGKYLGVLPTYKMAEGM